MSNMSEACRIIAADLESQYTKADLVKLARERGFTGDDARKSKSDIAAWLARNEKGETQPDGDNTPQPHQDAPQQPQQAEAVPQTQAVRAKPQPSPVKSSDVSAAVAQALAGVLSTLKIGVDEDSVNAIIDARLSAIQPSRIIIRGDAPQVTITDHVHPMFEKVLRLCNAGVNVLLVGPAGCGKSYLAKQVAKALNYDFGTIHCSAGVSESQVTGWLLPIGEGGAFKFMPSQFARLYVKGNSLFLIDEIDAADANMLTVLNGALANGALHIPQCADKPEWLRGDNTIILAAANTFGNGADAQYVGRNQLDAATVDRFYVVEMGYDEALEHAIAGLQHVPGKPWQAAAAPTAQEIQEIGKWTLSLREKATAAKLRRIVGTRFMQKAIAARHAGVSFAELKRDLLAGWTRDELNKVGE